MEIAKQPTFPDFPLHERKRRRFVSSAENNCIGLRLIKLHQVFCEGDSCSIIFQGTSDLRGEVTFEAQVSNDKVHRKVLRVRTLKPHTSQWYTGKFCVPLMSVTMDTAHVIPTFTDSAPAQPDKQRRSNRLMNQAKKSGKNAVAVKADLPAKPISRHMIALQPVVDTELVLHELSRPRRRIIETCAVLAMQDHAIQDPLNNCEGLRFIKLNNVSESGSSIPGDLFYINFQGASDRTGEATFEAVVWNTRNQRDVVRVRTLEPRLGEWYTGMLSVPLFR